MGAMQQHQELPSEFEVTMSRLVAKEIAKRSTATAEADAAIQADRDRRFQRMQVIVGIMAGVGPILVGLVLWLVQTGAAAKEQEIQAAAQQQQIEDTASKLEDHIAKSNERLDDIEKASVENQVLIVESVDHLGKKLDKISKKAADEVEPPILDKARKQANAAKARQVLFED